MGIAPVSSLLGAVNDLSSVTPFGSGWLVDTPFTFSDGDVISLHVDPLGDGFRVTDRAEALDRLAMWGVSIDSGRVAEAIKITRQAAGLVPIGTHSPYELATFGDARDLGSMILTVGQCAIRVEQLRWLARDRPSMKFDDRLGRRLEVISEQHRWRYRRRAEIPLPGDRTRRVTAVVEGARARAYVQAVSAADPEDAVGRCYYLFDRAEIAKDSKVAALAGTEQDWSEGLRSDLAAVSVVTFFEQPNSLEAELERITGAAPLPVA